MCVRVSNVYIHTPIYSMYRIYIYIYIYIYTYTYEGWGGGLRLPYICVGGGKEKRLRNTGLDNIWIIRCSHFSNMSVKFSKQRCCPLSNVTPLDCFAPVCPVYFFGLFPFIDC